VATQLGQGINTILAQIAAEQFDVLSDRDQSRRWRYRLTALRFWDSGQPFPGLQRKCLDSWLSSWQSQDTFKIGAPDSWGWLLKTRIQPMGKFMIKGGRLKNRLKSADVCYPLGIPVGRRRDFRSGSYQWFLAHGS